VDWVYVNFNIATLVDIIGKLCKYYGVNLSNVEVTYVPKFSYSLENKTPEQNNNDNSLELLDGTTDNMPSIPHEVIAVLSVDYANGFRFNTTSLRLLSDKSGIEVHEKMQALLKKIMFHRNDDVYFLLYVVADANTRKAINNLSDNFLDEYGCFEVSKLYARFADNLNSKCIDGADSFENFYEFINKRDVRCVEYYGTRIARINKSVRDLSIEISKKIISIVHDEYGGTLDEDELITRFPAFSSKLLSEIIKEHAEELVKIEINGIVCYQTLDALGLTDEFSETLYDVLEQIDHLELTPSEEVLHTALSIKLGVNFKAEYNIPDDKTYRRLIDTYYKSMPKRRWLRGIFAEEHN